MDGERRAPVNAGQPAGRLLVSEEEPTVVYTVRELIERIDMRVDRLEKSAARQVTVRWSVLLSVVSGPGAALLTFLLTRH